MRPSLLVVLLLSALPALPQEAAAGGPRRHLVPYLEGSLAAGRQAVLHPDAVPWVDRSWAGRSTATLGVRLPPGARVEAGLGLVTVGTIASRGSGFFLGGEAGLRARLTPALRLEARVGAATALAGDSYHATSLLLPSLALGTDRVGLAVEGQLTPGAGGGRDLSVFFGLRLGPPESYPLLAVQVAALALAGLGGTALGDLD